jgi:hypothetical protein
MERNNKVNQMVSNKVRRRSHVGGFSFGAESFGSAVFSYALWQPNHSGRRTVMLTNGVSEPRGTNRSG